MCLQKKEKKKEKKSCAPLVTQTYQKYVLLEFKQSKCTSPHKSKRHFLNKCWSSVFCSDSNSRRPFPQGKEGLDVTAHHYPLANHFNNTFAACVAFDDCCQYCCQIVPLSFLQLVCLALHTTQTFLDTEVTDWCAHCKGSLPCWCGTQWSFFGLAKRR